MSRKEGPNSNEVAQDKLRSREKLAREQRRADLAHVASSPDGRRFLYRMIFDECNLMSLYPGQDSGIYRNEGQRSVGFRIALEMQTDHTESYVAMIMEHLRDQENEKKLRDAALTDSSKGDE